MIPVPSISFARSLFVATVAALSVSTANADVGPIAVVPEATYEFGSVSQGAKVEHEFGIKNTGDSDLIIQRIAPSCGCTAAAMSAQAIKPGGQEKIKVTFNTAGFYGDKTKVVSVYTNAREQSTITLKVHGTVIRDVIVNPERIGFGELAPDASLPLRTREFSVEVVAGASREITKVHSLSKYLEVKPLGSEGAAKKYSVVLSPETPRGEFRDRVLIEFKDPDHSSINVPINASIVGDVRLIPSTISFGIIGGDQALERRVRFENSSRQSVEIQGVTSSHPAVSASVLPVEAGKRNVIVVTVDPRKVTADLKASIEVRTSHPQEQVLSLNVFGVQPPK